jgi:hypothetical protein
MIGHPAVIGLLNLLNERQIPYMISGSVASMFYGEPRLTHDLDLVIDIRLEEALGLQEVFGKQYYISEEGIKDALKHKTMFNIIHHDTGMKIDFWILTDSGFDRSRFKRRVQHLVEGTNYYFSSIEDTILIKLIWLKDSDHVKHADDIRGIIRLNGELLDKMYLRSWIIDLDLGAQAILVGLEI